MRLFWDRGYEATSIEDLTAAMGITASSLYRAFGDKHHLFLAAVDHYLAGTGGFGRPLLEHAPDARTAIDRLLHATARELTRGDQPIGCMIAISLMHASDASQQTRAALAARRATAQRAIRQIIQRDAKADKLAPGATAADLAAFYAAVIQGMTAQARDGASRRKLDRIADLAMRAWPGA
jgi:TetR/AcrR family transcriptional regulator, copper-responsive repressor